MYVLQDLWIEYSSVFEIKVQAGYNTLLWLENWVGDGTLATRFPNLFELDKRKTCFIGERVGPNNLKWAWKRSPNNPLEMAELGRLNGELLQLHVSDGWMNGDPNSRRMVYFIEVQITLWKRSPNRRKLDGLVSFMWKRSPNNPLEMAELGSLNGELSQLHVSDGMDEWRSKLSTNGIFYVKDLRELIDSVMTVPVANPTVWSRLVPLKVIGFVWHTCLDWLPTTKALSVRESGCV
ncbi:hypothetical protein LXL04_009671 [Taraxacum kok-saghyz]